MLLPLVPLAAVHSAIGPLELAVTMLSVVHVATNVLAAVLPRESSDSVHFVLLPLPLEAALIPPHIHALPIDIVVPELSQEARIINPLKLTEAVLLAIGVHALKVGAIGPYLHAKAILFVIVPEPNILRPIDSLKSAIAVRLIRQPLPVVAVAIDVYEATLAVHLVRLPQPLKLAAILPHLHAVALALSILVPLAHVHGVVVELAGAFFDEVGYEIDLRLVHNVRAELGLGTPRRLIEIVRQLVEEDGAMASPKINVSIFNVVSIGLHLIWWLLVLLVVKLVLSVPLRFHLLSDEVAADHALELGDPFFKIGRLDIREPQIPYYFLSCFLLLFVWILIYVK